MPSTVIKSPWTARTSNSRAPNLRPALGAGRPSATGRVRWPRTNGWVARAQFAPSFCDAGIVAAHANKRANPGGGEYQVAPTRRRRTDTYGPRIQISVHAMMIDVVHAAVESIILLYSLARVVLLIVVYTRHGFSTVPRYGFSTVPRYVAQYYCTFEGEATLYANIIAL